MITTLIILGDEEELKINIQGEITKDDIRHIKEEMMEYAASNLFDYTENDIRNAALIALDKLDYSTIPTKNKFIEFPYF